MQIHNLTQGSPEWLAYRAKMRNASDAPAMMGCSPYKTRAQLLRELHTGVVAEVDVATQKRFDNGHRAEALARPLAEEIIGAELYPVTGSLGSLSASFDGLTMDESMGFEHKALNADIRAAFDAMAENPVIDPGYLLPVYHRIQMEQQLHVSGAERILFMASEWDADGNLVEERHCWYYPDAELRAEILRGWEQFDRDLAAYVPPAAAEPPPVGKAPESLPALRIELTGQVTASNLAEFKATALGAIRAVNRNLKTDQDFADAEKAVKWCADVEARLKAAKEHALSQTASIDELFRALDEIAAESKAARLDLDKLVTRRKTEVKEEAVTAARAALDLHIAAVNAEIAPMRLLPQQVDFAGAIKGKRSIDSMQDALDTLLASAKIAADAQGRAIRANVQAFKAATGDDTALQALFADLHQLAHKPADDFVTLVDARIAKHRADMAERERLTAERRVLEIAAAEERARQQERDRLAAEQRQREEAEAAAAAQSRPAPVPLQVSEPAHPVRTIVPPPASAPVWTVTTTATAPAANEPATLKLGDINARLSPLKLDASGMAELGIRPARTEGAAKLYRESDYERLLRAITKHVDSLQAVPA